MPFWQWHNKICLPMPYSHQHLGGWIYDKKFLWRTVSALQWRFAKHLAKGRTAASLNWGRSKFHFPLVFGWFGYQTASTTRILIFWISSFNQSSKLRYQSKCADQRPQPPAAGSWQQVSSHCLPQDGHRPAVSKVCHEWPQVHCHRSAGVGSQLHFGQAILTSAIFYSTYGGRWTVDG